MSVKKVFHPEELKKMTDEELADIIESTLYTDASELSYAAYDMKDKALGLEGVLFRCAFCGKKYSTVGKDNEFGCTACGKKLLINENYHFTEWPHTISGYYEKIREEEKAELGSLSLAMKVRLKAIGKNGRIEKKEQGECFLDKENFRYRSESEDFVIPVSDLPGLAFSCKTEIELYRGESLYYFYPETDPVQAAEWALVIDLLAEKRGEN